MIYNFLLGKQTVKSLDYNKIQIKRGELLQSDIEREEDDKGYFRRYALTGNGISPRPIPGVKVAFITSLVLNIMKRSEPSEAASIDKHKWKNVCVKQVIEKPIESNENMMRQIYYI